jgi:predicted nucleic acid-binding protein
VIVVSDTSPLNYLVLIQAVEVLPGLFEQVIVPTKVMEEMLHSRSPAAVRSWASMPPNWLRVKTPSRAMTFNVALDPGESQAIALAKELNVPLILIDERKGRRVATELGLAVVGTITVLEKAAEQGILDLPQALQALQRTSFHMSIELLQSALQRDVARRKGIPRPPGAPLA